MSPKTLCLSILALVGAASSVPGRSPAATLGPPILCHPIEIGTAASLPFGKGAFDHVPELADDQVRPETLRILDGDDAVLVHMETLRRAVVYLAHRGGGTRRSEVRNLIGELERRARAAKTRLEAAPTDGKLRRGAAVAAFDFAFAAAALRESGWKETPMRDTLDWLDAAVRWEPRDGALRLGAALIHYSRGDRDDMYPHLDVALSSVTAPEDLLDRNICRTMGSFLGAANHAALVALVRDELERA